MVDTSSPKSQGSTKSGQLQFPVVSRRRGDARNGKEGEPGAVAETLAVHRPPGTRQAKPSSDPAPGLVILAHTRCRDRPRAVPGGLRGPAS